MQFAIQIDRPDLVLAGKLVEHRGDDPPNIMFLVAKIVEQSFQRGVHDLQLRCGQFQPERGLSGADEVIVHLCGERYPPSHG